MTTPDSAPTNSVIHDIGFRHYDGPRLGRGWAFRSLLLETYRGAFGLGRPAKVKIMPWVLVGLFTIPAIVIVAVTIVTGADHAAAQLHPVPRGAVTDCVAIPRGTSPLRGVA